MALAVVTALLGLILLVAGCSAEDIKKPGNTNGGLSQSQKDDFLNKHNQYRHMEKATNMNTLKWNDNLARSAQNAANTCVFEHTGSDIRGSAGENIYVTSARGFCPASVVWNWWSEIKDYTFSTKAKTGVVGHYTQVVWADTKEVGCAVKYCTDMKEYKRVDGYIYKDANGNKVLESVPYTWIVFCHYSPAGNYNGLRPFECDGDKTSCNYHGDGSDANKCSASGGSGSSSSGGSTSGGNTGGSTSGGNTGGSTSGGNTGGSTSGGNTGGSTSGGNEALDMVSLDEACKKNNKNFGACNIGGDCSKLYCWDQPNSGCTNWNHYTRHGTVCGKGKLCDGGNCVDDPTGKSDNLDANCLWGDHPQIESDCKQYASTDWLCQAYGSTYCCATCKGRKRSMARRGDSDADELSSLLKRYLMKKKVETLLEEEEPMHKVR